MSSISNPYAPPRAAVRDVVDPLVDAELADLSTRLGAAILEGIIFMGMVYAPMIVLGVVLPSIRAASGARVDGPDAMTMIGLLGTLTGLVAWIWLNVKYILENGQSIAKRICGIKVVRSNGAPASLGRIFWLRNVVNAMLGIVPLYGLIDILFIFGEKRQCLHDKLADTIVIKA